MAAAAEQPDRGWYAKLRLGYKKTASKTVLAERSREGPLAVQRALYPEGDLCHTYLLHPPGGVAGGDSLDIQARVTCDAAALVTTPGATKFYRSAAPWAHQQQMLEVIDGSLEWLPQENILFPGAKAELSTSVDLYGDAVFIGWEIVCLGRPAVQERFDRGEAIFSFSLRRNDLPLLIERLHIRDEKTVNGAAELRGKPVIGVFYATPGSDTEMQLIRQEIAQNHCHELGVTLVDGLLVARYLGESTELARRLFTEMWKLLRPVLMKRAPCVPRIWNT